MEKFKKIRIPPEKRILDIVVSLLVIVIFSPFIVLILLLMLLEFIFVPQSRGPIFYTETRISRGEPFLIYKFRIFKKSSIAKAAALNGTIHTKDLENDPRNLTFVGRFLKKVYMDELPQFINVLKGQMSIVGPRPKNIADYQRAISRGQYSKALILAGITGYFQTHKAVKLQQSQEELDMAYVNFCQNNSGWKVMWYDLKIILMTIWAMLKAEGL